MAQVYSRSPLPPTSRIIRLIELFPGRRGDPIKCTLRTTNLDGAVYNALSYVWGDPGVTHAITVNDEEVQVTVNLEKALQYLRLETHSLVYWVDALCINQHDVVEKTHQVGLMGEIYKQCAHAYFWLGGGGDEDGDDSETHDEGAQNLHAFLDHFLCEKHIDELPGCSPDDGDQQAVAPWFCAIQKITDSAWWDRLWTVQEAILPDRATVVYGTWRVPWQTLYTVTLNITMHERGRCCFKTARSLPDAVYATMFRFTGRVNGLASVKEDLLRLNYHPGLIEALRVYREREASDPRDLVFGILGLLARPSVRILKPDYSLPLASVFQLCIEQALLDGKGDLEPLAGAGAGSGKYGLPSWVRDLTFKSHVGNFLDNEIGRGQCYAHYKASGALPAHYNVADRGRLILRGCPVDRVSRRGPPADGRRFAGKKPTYRAWMDMTGVPLDLWPSQLPSGSPSVFASFWRTLLGDCGHEFYKIAEKSEPTAQEGSGDRTTSITSSVRSVAGAYHESFVRATPREMAAYEQWITFMKTEGQLRPQWDSVTDKSVSYATALTDTGRCMYMTAKGHLGMCYRVVEPGDEVWILQGGKVPFILRPCKDDAEGEASRSELGADCPYTLVGDCYLDGFMDGEAIESGQYQSREVVLC